MKIAHVSPEYYPTIGGVGQVVRELAERQAEQGNEVHVFAPDWDKEKRISKKEETINRVHIHRCFHIAKIANFNTLWPSVFFRLVKKRFNIIHSHNFGQSHFFFSAIAAKLSGAKHIHTTHCPWSDAKRSLLGKLGVILSYNLFSKWALKRTDKIIAITPWELNFIKKFGGEKSKTIVIPNGMSSEFFLKMQKNTFKKRHKINGKMVLFFGRLNPTKSPDKFVEIAKLILRERKDVFFVIRGPDEGMRAKVKEMIGKEKRIILLPETRDKKEIIEMYQSADVYVLPSYREGLPLTLFEAMSCGLPIVATPVNGVQFEIKNNENGFLVKHGNNEEFKKRILQILTNKKLKDKMSKNNKNKARQYDWNLINKKVIGVYNEARS